MSACISFRQSIRWLPDVASEPTQTIVLTGLKTGVFLDVRFEKETGKLDWAFAGYRTTERPNVTKFQHCIDSRTAVSCIRLLFLLTRGQTPLDVVDIGHNQPLPDGCTLEAGEMVNPATGILTRYEEIWRDEEYDRGLFVRNATATIWRACVGGRQLALGRTDSGFWAWEASKETQNGEWTRGYSTGEFQDANAACFLPDEDTDGWRMAARVEWAGECWDVLEN
ncbi:hypothetical protein C8F01DRAFT_991326 [Mycena amicta]|nr:hypothetical protein C8F01DRAFT_991326 [Mycena amicta]